VCVYIYLSIYIYIYMHVHVSLSLYRCSMCVSVCLSMYACTRVHVSEHMRVSVSLLTFSPSFSLSRHSCLSLSSHTLTRSHTHTLSLSRRSPCIGHSFVNYTFMTEVIDGVAEVNVSVNGALEARPSVREDKYSYSTPRQWWSVKITGSGNCKRKDLDPYELGTHTFLSLSLSPSNSHTLKRSQSCLPVFLSISYTQVHVFPLSISQSLSLSLQFERFRTLELSPFHSLTESLCVCLFVFCRLEVSAHCRTPLSSREKPGTCFCSVILCDLPFFILSPLSPLSSLSPLSPLSPLSLVSSHLSTSSIFLSCFLSTFLSVILFFVGLNGGGRIISRFSLSLSLSLVNQITNLGGLFQEELWESAIR
jgi:hypothetical protein